MAQPDEKRELARPPGRPPKLDTEPPASAPDIIWEVLNYVCRHPGCVVAGDDRRRYSIGFRQFILELLESHRDITVEGFAEASTIPLGTLKDWLRGGTEGLQPAEKQKTTIDLGCRGPQMEAVLAEWDEWTGPFTAFCDHVQLHCRIPFGRTLISTILEEHDARARVRRPSRALMSKVFVSKVFVSKVFVSKVFVSKVFVVPARLSFPTRSGSVTAPLFSFKLTNGSLRSTSSSTSIPTPTPSSASTSRMSKIATR